MLECWRLRRFRVRPSPFRGGGIIQGVSVADYVAPNELWVGGTNVVDSGYWTTNEKGGLTESDSSNYNVYYDGDGNLWLNNANIVGQGSGNAATGIYAYYDNWVDTDIALTIHRKVVRGHDRRELPGHRYFNS